MQVSFLERKTTEMSLGSQAQEEPGQDSNCRARQWAGLGAPLDRGRAADGGEPRAPEGTGRTRQWFKLLGTLPVTIWEEGLTATGTVKWLGVPKGSCSSSLSTSVAPFKALPRHLNRDETLRKEGAAPPLPFSSPEPGPPRLHTAPDRG